MIKLLLVFSQLTFLNIFSFLTPDSLPGTTSLYPELKPLIAGIEDPASLSTFMQEHFSFEYDRDLFDKMDYWQSPEEFWSLKKGDCEDYALFTQYVLEQKGIEAYLVSIYGKSNYAHTITVFKEGKGYNVFNQDILYEFQASSIEEAITSLMPDWFWGAIAERKGHRGWMHKKLLKIEPLNYQTSRLTSSDKTGTLHSSIITQA